MVLPFPGSQPPMAPMAPPMMGGPPMLQFPTPPPPAPGPKNLPPWADTKKPKADRVVELAYRDRERFAGYVAKVAELLRKTEDGIGSVFEADKDNGDLIGTMSPALKNEIERFISWGANHEFKINAPFTDPLNADEASDMEDAGYYWLECWIRQHAAAGWGDLKHALFDTDANYGRLATLVCCDFNDAECGLTFRMLDPATTFPVWEGKRGLGHVSLVYSTSVAELIGFYTDDAMERKLKKLVSASSTESDHHWLDHEGEVVEWIDRAWHGVYWEGQEVRCKRHGYGIVPVRYDRGPGGRQGFTSTSAIAGMHDISVHEDHVTHEGRQYASQYVTRGGRGDARLDESKTGLPFGYWKLPHHRQMEAINSHLTTALVVMTDPAVWVRQGYESEQQGIPEVSLKPRSVSTFREDEQPEIPQLPINPQVISAVIGQMQADQVMGGAGPVAFGQNPAAQTTGSAAGILDAEGKEIWAPWLRVVEQHVTGVMELAALLYKDWGEIIGAPGSRGIISVPRQNPRAGQAQAFDLTPEMLERVGIRFEVNLHRFNANTLAQLAAGIVQLMNVNVIGQEDAMDIVGFHQNTRAAIQRLREEQLSSAPEIVQADQLEVLVDNMFRATTESDRKRAAARLKLVATKMAMAEQQQQMMMQSMQLGQNEMQMDQAAMAMGLPPGVPPTAVLPKGMMPGGAPSPIPPGGTGSLPQFGVNVGQQGGRPQGPPPPGMPPGGR